MSSEEKEQYFMAQVGIGESLATEGQSWSFFICFPH